MALTALPAWPQDWLSAPTELFTLHCCISPQHEAPPWGHWHQVCTQSMMLGWEGVNGGTYSWQQPSCAQTQSRGIRSPPGCLLPCFLVGLVVIGRAWSRSGEGAEEQQREEKKWEKWCSSQNTAVGGIASSPAPPPSLRPTAFPAWILENWTYFWTLEIKCLLDNLGYGERGKVPRQEMIETYCHRNTTKMLVKLARPKSYLILGQLCT